MRGEVTNLKFSTLTEVCVLIQAFFIGLGTIGVILDSIFVKLDALDFILAGYFISISSSIICVVWLCKLFVDFIHRKLNVKDLTKYRNDYLTAFGTIGIFSLVLRILAFFPELSVRTIILTYLVYFISTPAIYFFFVLPTFDKKCTWRQMDEATRDKFIWTTVIGNLVLLIVSIRIAVDFNDIETGKRINVLQFIWAVPSTITLTEFAYVLLIGVQLINVDERRNAEAAQPVESRRVTNEIIARQEPEPISTTFAPKPSCNICSIPYTETGIHTPRMLRECGHTICEQCADKLVNVKCRKILICPFCENPTVVNGSAGTLPKNFALLEYTRDFVQRNKDPSKIA